MEFKYKKSIRSIMIYMIITKLSKERCRSTEVDLQKINCSQFERAFEYRNAAIDSLAYRCGIIAFACCTSYREFIKSSFECPMNEAITAGFASSFLKYALCIKIFEFVAANPHLNSHIVYKQNVLFRWIFILVTHGTP